ncbi:alkaline-phosphatase-like protein [Geopyxis carbonaria]|nr:alkaline-phosphatase-like protein [Geopyxis carbonaria]
MASFARNLFDPDAREYTTVPGAHPETSDEDTDVDYSTADALDREVLREEEEREKLLSRGSLFSSIGRTAGRVKVGKKVRGAGRKRAAGDVAEMMDGQPRKPTLRKIVVFTMLLLSFLLLLIFVSLGLSHPRPASAPGPQLLYSNGTHAYAKTTLLISLDGLRADFLTRGLTPTLNSFINSGVSPPYMLPSFPSVTFPNHWTLATGLHPESHGIVGNSFWDPDTAQEFYYTDPARSLQTHWWGGEPIWRTAERQGLRAAVHMWPGSEAAGCGATTVDDFNGTESLPRKVDRILHWLDLPAAQRPQFIAAYVPDVDAAGHKFGPNSTETDAQISAVDGMLHNLFLGLEARNLTELVNIVVVSDHGMASTSNSRLIYLEDLLDPSLIAHTDGWPLYGLRPRPSANLTALHASLLAKQPADGSWTVHLRDIDMPARWHFSRHARIAPLWLVPATGWAIVTAREHPRPQVGEYSPRGLHGYDNAHPLMRAIFVARGPAFAHMHGPGREVRPFQNTEVYRLLCQSLGIGEAASNATLSGLELMQPGELVDDDAGSDAGEGEGGKNSSSYAPPTRPVKQPGKIIEVSPPGPPPGEEGKEGDDGKEGKEGDLDWWQFLKLKADRLREKMGGWWNGVWRDDAAKKAEAAEEGKGS